MNESGKQYSEFCDLCRRGKLFAVQEWLAERSVPSLHTNRRADSPLQIAVEAGNHSLAELLLRSGCNPDANALWAAVESRREDLVELLFDHGAEAKWVSFVEVAKQSSVEVAKLFIKRGADLITGLPLLEGILVDPKAWIPILLKRSKRKPELRDQLNGALLRFCSENCTRDIKLLLKAGADPRAEAPWSGEGWSGVGDTALEVAVWKGNIELLKLLGIRRSDDLNDLLCTATRTGQVAMMRFLIELGADPNHTGADGRCVWGSLCYALDSYFDLPTYTRERFKTLDAVEAAMTLGAKLDQINVDQRRRFRMALCKMEPDYASNFITVLINRNACSQEKMGEILNNPSVQKHLANHRADLAHVVTDVRRWGR